MPSTLPVIAFMCWDHELNEAADKHGFVLIPEQS